MKARILLTVALTLGLLAPVVAQEVNAVGMEITQSFHGERAQAWSMPATLDGSAGVADYPNSSINFVTQLATRFTLDANSSLLSVNLWLDAILSGAVDETVSYHRPEAAFTWPFPFNHVPQTFEKKATRFTSPDAARLRNIEIYPFGIESSDGANDTVKISLFEPLVPTTTTVKYGNENVNNNPSYRFNFPILSGNVRLAYGTRFTTPATPDSFLVSGFEYYVFHINGETQFLPAGNNPPDDTLVVKIWSPDDNNLPGEVLATQKIPFANLQALAWNQVSFLPNNVYMQGGEDFILTFETIIVDLSDHIALVSGEPFTNSLERSVMFENGEWKLLANSTSFGSGPAKNAELWTRSQLIASDQVTNDELTPDESKPIGEPVKVPLSSLTVGEFNTINFNDQNIQLSANQNFWAVVELIENGSPDRLVFISDGAETETTFRTAVYVSDGDGSSWKYMHNTQFNNEFIWRMNATFGIADETEVKDDIFVILYSDNEGLPGNFVNLKEVPLASLTVGEMTEIDVTSWSYSTQGDFHIAIGGAFDNNQFSLASDDGSNELGENRSTAYFSLEEAWVALADLDGVDEVNLLMNIVQLTIVSIDPRDQLPSEFRLHGNYPNPFNPTTTIQFDLADAGQARLTVYDVIGRQVAELVNQTMSAGTHSVQFNAGSNSSGTYILRLEAGGQTFTSKMLLVK
jgi:hypothetical protein